MSKAYSGLAGFENFLDEDTTPDQVKKFIQTLFH